MMKKKKIVGSEERDGHTFLARFIVTLTMPGTGFMPNFCIAFLLFFSLRLCFPLPLVSA
jgi:hypothetical protein